MAFLRMVAWTGVLIGLSTATLQGQGRHATVIIAPLGQPRIGYIASPPPPAPAQPAVTYGQTVFVTLAPIVTADGQVLVDLGNGYQEVTRACPLAYGYACPSYGYPAASLTHSFQQYTSGTTEAPRYAPPAHAAPASPVPVYSGGYYSEPRTSRAATYQPAHSSPQRAASSRASGPRVGTRRP